MTQWLLPDWNDKIVYGAVGPQPSILAEDEKLKLILAGLEPGQRIPSHPEAAAVYHFLEGNGWMTVDDERRAIEPGSIMITSQGASRGVEAETRLVFLGTRVP